MRRGLPRGEILLGDCGKLRIQFYADDFLERRVRRDHDRAALAATDINEGVITRRAGKRLLPVFKDGFEGRWSCAPVGCAAAGVEMFRVEIFALDVAAGVDVVAKIEGVGWRSKGEDSYADRGQQRVESPEESAFGYGVFYARQAGR